MGVCLSACWREPQRILFFFLFFFIYELRQRSNAKQDEKIYHPDGVLTVSDNMLMPSKYIGKLSILVLRVCMLLITKCNSSPLNSS